MLDLGLPGGSGFDVVENLRNRPEQAHIPVLIYTAREVGPEDLDRLRLGETRAFVKTRVTAQAFEEAVVTLLEKLAATPVPQ
jgi:CheY-like chemotaxis protein